MNNRLSVNTEVLGNIAASVRSLADISPYGPIPFDSPRIPGFDAELPSADSTFASGVFLSMAVLTAVWVAFRESSTKVRVAGFLLAGMLVTATVAATVWTQSAHRNYEERVIEWRKSEDEKFANRLNPFWKPKLPNPVGDAAAP